MIFNLFTLSLHNCFASTHLSILETVVECFNLRYERFTTQYLAAILSGFSFHKSPRSKFFRSHLGKTLTSDQVDRQVDLIESRQDPQAIQVTILASSCRLGDPQMTAKAKKYYLRTLFSISKRFDDLN